MDLNCEKGDDLKEFLINNDYKNYVSKDTRIATYLCSKTNTLKTTKTLIDVIIHNGDKVLRTDSFNCS